MAEPVQYKMRVISDGHEKTTLLTAAEYKAMFDMIKRQTKLTQNKAIGKMAKGEAITVTYPLVRSEVKVTFFQVIPKKSATRIRFNAPATADLSIPQDPSNAAS